MAVINKQTQRWGWLFSQWAVRPLDRLMMIAYYFLIYAYYNIPEQDAEKAVKVMMPKNKQAVLFKATDDCRNACRRQHTNIFLFFCHINDFCYFIYNNRVDRRRCRTYSSKVLRCYLLFQERTLEYTVIIFFVIRSSLL